MHYQALYIVIIIILVAGYMLELWLGYLNTTTWSELLPLKLKGIYDDEKYREQQLFERTKYRFGILTGAFSFLVIAGMFVFKGFALLDGIILGFTNSPVVQALLFFGILGLFSDLLATPFDVYHTFVIEQRFGFNTTTIRTYIFDKLKAWLLAGLLGGGILALIVLLYEKTGSWFWLLAWGLVTFFTVFINYFYTVLILPLFNKLKPLPGGELREAIEDFASTTGFSISNIFVIDGSKRSKRGNAYFSGFGKQKRIVLYDTLITEHPTNELVAILAHEIGHYKKKHVLKGLIVSVLHTGALLWILSYFIGNPALSLALGSSSPSFHMGLVAFAILYSPVSIILGLIMNVFSRKHEYEADRFAATSYDAYLLQQALKGLSVKNLSNLTPHPWYVFFNYSHPTLLQRLDALEKIREKQA